jgi:hypothetical protein
MILELVIEEDWAKIEPIVQKVNILDYCRFIATSTAISQELKQNITIQA